MEVGRRFTLPLTTTSADEPTTSAQDQNTSMDSELLNTSPGYIDIPCEIWMEIAELVDGVDVLKLSSVRRFLPLPPKLTPKFQC